MTLTGGKMKSRTWTVRKYVLYNFDRDRLATRTVFTRYQDAAEVAHSLANVIIMPLVLKAVTAAGPKAA